MMCRFLPCRDEIINAAVLPLVLLAFDDCRLVGRINVHRACELSPPFPVFFQKLNQQRRNVRRRKRYSAALIAQHLRGQRYFFAVRRDAREYTNANVSGDFCEYDVSTPADICINRTLPLFILSSAAHRHE